MGFCVIATGERMPGFAAMAAALAAAFGLDRQAAAVQARHCWGVFARDLEAAAADAVVGHCAACGIKTIKLPAEALAQLPAAHRIKKIGFEKEYLAWMDAAGNAGTVRAREITALSAAPVKEETMHLVKTKEGPSGAEKAVRMGIMSVTGLPIGLGKTKETIKEVRGNELAFYLDIISGSDEPRLRLSPVDFDFSCLKERKTYSSEMNFRLLALELAAFVPAALNNAALWAMRENTPLNALPYDTMEDFETETRRLAALGNKIR